MSLHKRLLICFILGISLFVCLPLKPVHADGFKLTDAIEEFGEKRFIRLKPARLHAGPVRIYPSLRTSAEYDTNILLESTDAREDVIFNLKPGVILELPINRHQLAIGYEADIEVFSKSRSARQNDQNQSFFALVDLQFPSWYVNVLERFSETSGRSGTTFTDRIPRYDQSINPKIGYRWKRFTFEGAFQHALIDYRQQVNDAIDNQMVSWTGVLFYDLFARLKALLEYQVAQIDYDDDFTRNGTFQQVRIGFDGELMPNLRAKLKTGVQFRNYDESSEPNFNSWVANIWVEYAMRKNLKFTLTFDREPVEATFGSVNYYLQHSTGFGIEYEPWQKWILFTQWEYARQSYAERATVGTRSGYRRDSNFSTKYGIRYTMNEWMEIETYYQYLRRDSNFSSLDYTDHRFGISTNLTY